MVQIKFTVLSEIAIVLLVAVLIQGTPCNLRQFPAGYVCVCNETYCDSYDDIALHNDNEFVLASTSKGGLRFNVMRGPIDLAGTKIVIEDLHDDVLPSSTFCSPSNDRVVAKIDVRVQKKYQKMLGFGGAFTGAVSYILDLLPKKMQHYMYRSYYSATDGNNFNFMRMTIGGCDFDLKPWSYAETPINDTTLSGFTSLNAEDKQKIRQIKELEHVTNNYNIKKFAATWTSPRWMKSHHMWDGKSSMLPQFYQAWADYYLRWLQLMKEQNMTFWGISTQNEPTMPIIYWEHVDYVSLGWTAQNQGKWVAKHLGPLIRSSEFKDIKLIGCDDQRFDLPYWLKQMDIGHPNASNFLNTIALHWYADGFVPPSYLDEAHELFPEKNLLLTESCIFTAIILGSWEYAEQYIFDYIQNFAHYVQGWVIWNLWLDLNGGPNYANNFVNAPIMVNTTSRTEFYKNPAFYTIGQFSKFVIPESIRIEVTSSDGQIPTIGFQRPDSSIVIIMYNNNTQPAVVDVSDGEKLFSIRMPAKTIQTLLYAHKS